MRFDKNGDTEFQLERILNEGIELDDNVRGGFLEILTTGERQEIEHNLGYTPIGWIVLLQDGEGDLWATDLELWNNHRLFLQSNVTNLTVRLFVM